MQPLPELSEDDTHQWLSHGYVDYDNRCWRFEGSSHMDGEVQLYSTDGEEGSISVPYYDVNTHWPECGAVNITHSTYAVYVARRQSRQWRRTYNQREVRVTTPDLWEIMKYYGGVLSDLSPDNVAQSVFYPQYPTTAVARTQLNSQMKLSVALSPTVILAGRDKIRVYLRTEFVAIVDGFNVIPVSDSARTRRVMKTLGGGYTLCL